MSPADSHEHERRNHELRRDETEPVDPSDLGLMSVPDRAAQEVAAQPEHREARRSGEEAHNDEHEHDAHAHMRRFPMFTLNEERELVEVDPGSLPSDTSTYGPEGEDDQGPRSRRRGKFGREDPRERRDKDHRNEPGHQHDHDH